MSRPLSQGGTVSPANAIPDAAPTRWPCTLDGVPPQSILLVDDDPDVRRLAALSLERIGGFRVTLATGAREALEQVGRFLPDLILLDVSMPEMDGPATMAALRLAPSMHGVPIVFLTAGASDTEVARLRALGAIGVIAKPFDLRELPVRIRDIAASAGMD
jgi:two-component system, OmpR family, response regulator